MSHFTVGVFTVPGGKSVEDLLAPFHEFECTGMNDEYVQNVDLTEEAMTEYQGYKLHRYKDAEGILHDPGKDEFYRDLTAEEEKLNLGGVGCGHGISWCSKDWGDGRGYRPKVSYIPEGWVEVEVPAPEAMSFRDFVDYYYGKAEVISDDPDFVPVIGGDKECKYGWTQVNSAGDVVKVIRRTNPNSKWDWYSVGGRWSGCLLVPEGTLGTEIGKRRGNFDMERDSKKNPPGYTWVDVAKVSDIQWDIMREISRENAEAYWEEACRAENAAHGFFMFGVRAEDTRESYIDRQTGFSTYAVITPDGVWHSKGEMGWWACSSETTEEANAWAESFHKVFIETADPEATLTMVDCHI